METVVCWLLVCRCASGAVFAVVAFGVLTFVPSPVLPVFHTGRSSAWGGFQKGGLGPEGALQECVSDDCAY